MKRIIIAGFKHETNSFAPQLTTLEDYRKRSLRLGREITEYYQGTSSEMGGLFDVFGAREDVELLPVIDANAMPGGPVAREAYDYIKGVLLEALEREQKAGRPISGIALVLHGAQITEDTEDGEGLLLRELRRVVGPRLPIVATLDFHANLTREMVELSSALFPARYYPHTDFYERGRDAARMLLDILDGKAHPTAAFLRMRLIYPHSPTDEGALGRLTPLLEAESGRNGAYSVNFVAGFCRGDISCHGACIYALTEADPEGARALCLKYARDVREHLEDYRLLLTDPAEAVRTALSQEGLTVIADAADNPGSGLMNDATEILHELLRQHADRVAVSSIWDPETVRQAMEAGPGSTIHVRLGGKSGPLVGAPVETDAYVKALSDGTYVVKGPVCRGLKQSFGPTAVLQFAGISCLVTSVRNQTYDEEAFRAHGIEPLDCRIVVVKSAVHFRAAWRKVSDRLFVVDMPNLTSIDEKKIAYRHLPRPIYPLEDAETVRAAGFWEEPATDAGQRKETEEGGTHER